MSYSNALADYISSFENSIVYSTSDVVSQNQRDRGNQYNQSTSFLFNNENKNKKISQFNFDEIPTKENDFEQSQCKEEGKKLLNFKEYYEISQLQSKSQLSNQRSKSSAPPTKLFQKSQLQSQQKKSAFEYNINDFLPKDKNSEMKNLLSGVGVSEYQSRFQNNKNNILDFQPQQITNIFKQNAAFGGNSTISKHTLQQQNAFLQASQNIPTPNSNMYSPPSLQCSCSKNQLPNNNNNLILTQRSSVCSCVYSQASSCQSLYQSPHGQNSQFRPSQAQQQIQQNNSNINIHHQLSHQQPLTGTHLQSCLNNQNLNQNGINQVRSVANLHHLNSNSSENTPLKSFQNNQNTQQDNTNSNKSPQRQFEQIRQQQYEDRSMSFLHTSNKKSQGQLQTLLSGRNGGYNTDDLLRDSESEIDLNQVSNILQEVSNNFQEGFQQLIKTSNLSNNLDREQRERLAMQILNNQNKLFEIPQGINDSQVKTLKSKQRGNDRGPVLTLENLLATGAQSINNNTVKSTQQTTIMTPVSAQNFNFQSNGADQTRKPHFIQVNPSSRNHIQQIQQPNSSAYQSNVTLQQQYMSPCFNSLEESNQAQKYFQQNQSNTSYGSGLHYSSVPLQENQIFKEVENQQNKRIQIFQQQKQPGKSQNKNASKSKSRQKSKKEKMKLLKKSFNNDQLTHSSSEGISNKENSSEESSHSSSNDKKKKKRSNSINMSKSQKSNKSKLKQSTSQSNYQHSIVKVLREMSIQTSQSFINGGELELSGSFLDKTDNKSDIQVQTDKPRNEVSCQVDSNQEDISNFQHQTPNEIYQQRSNSSLPPAQRKFVPQLQKLPNYNMHPNVKSLGGSVVTSSKCSSVRIPIQNNHFQSQIQNELDLYLDDESIQFHQSVRDEISQQTTNDNIHQQQRSNPTESNHTITSIQPPLQKNFNGGPYQNFYPQIQPHHQQNHEHFKSHCSEVVIRGSSETDISNKIALYRNRVQSQNTPLNQQSQSNSHSHQISGCQSVSQREKSQFTSIETAENISPNRRLYKITESQSHESNDFEHEENLHNGGDTFNNHRDKQIQIQYNMINSEDSNYNQPLYNRTDQTNFYQQQQNRQLNSQFQSSQQYQTSEHQTNTITDSQQEDEQFNYTVNLNRMNNDNEQNIIVNKNAQLPPIYVQRQQNTAPLQTQAFEKQKYQIQAQNTQQNTSGLCLKKMSFMEKIVFIQQNVRRFMSRIHAQRLQAHLQSDPLQFGESSTINKLHEGNDSISNLSSSYLNTYKQYLNKQNQNEQSYQKNIMESLNLTTGNTFMNNQKIQQQTQGGTQQFSKGHNLGNTSGMVIFSDSTHDNRIPNILRPQNIQEDQIESQASSSKYPQMTDFELNHQFQQTQQSPNNMSLLNLTEESSSAIFKLTPVGSQNVTQKTNILSVNQTSHIIDQNQHKHERTNESNNLNYSYSECDSEWAISQIQKDNNVSPMSVNTTSSKVLKNNGIGQSRIHKGFGLSKMVMQKQKSVQSDTNLQYQQQQQDCVILINHNELGQVQQVQSAYNASKYSQKIKIEEDINNLQSPSSMNQMTTSKSANSAKSKQEQLLNILKSQDYDKTLTSTNSISKTQKEWVLLNPVKENDFKSLLVNLLAQQIMNQQQQQQLEMISTQ